MWPRQTGLGGRQIPDTCKLLIVTNVFPSSSSRSSISDINSPFIRYQYYGTGGSWSSARVACRSLGGDLAHIHNQNEQTAVAAVASGHEAWIGCITTVAHTTWTWADDSTAVTQTWWSSGVSKVTRLSSIYSYVYTFSGAERLLVMQSYFVFDVLNLQVRWHSMHPWLERARRLLPGLL